MFQYFLPTIFRKEPFLNMISDRKKIHYIILTLFFLLIVSLAFAEKETGNSLSNSEKGISAFIKTGDLKTLVETSGIIYALFTILIAGFLLSFTPCIYPMIPITLGIIGARSQGKPIKGLTLSIVYVFGIAITFSILGIAASIFGAVFGALLQSKIVLIILTLLFFILSLSMFGAFDFQIPSGIASKIQSKGDKGGYIGAFIMGLAAGVVASPCSSPVLVGMIAYVAQLKSPFLGFLYFFTFAWGIGILFIILGTFPSLLTSLPKAGTWMNEIKHFFGLLLLIAAFYFLRLVLIKHISLFYFLLCAASITLSVFAGTFTQLKPESTTIEKIKKSFGILILLIGIFAFLKLSIPYIIIEKQPQIIKIKSDEILDMAKNNSSSEIIWIKNIAEGKKLAAEQNKPLFLDFYADWCLPCKEMDATTFKDKNVIEESKRFICVKVDNTSPNEEAIKLLKELELQPTFPTYIFYNSKGEYQKDAAMFGYIKAEDFIKKMQLVR